MSNNKENFIRADPVPTDAEIELAVERLRPNWTRGVPRSRTGGTSHILQSLAHGRSHAVVLEIKRSPRRLPSSSADCHLTRPHWASILSSVT
jgi:hypothetical protein